MVTRKYQTALKTFHQLEGTQQFAKDRKPRFFNHERPPADGTPDSYGHPDNIPISRTTKELLSNLKLHIGYAWSGGSALFVFLGASGHGKSTAIYRTNHGGNGLILGIIHDEKFKDCQRSLTATQTDDLLSKKGKSTLMSHTDLDIRSLETKLIGLITSQIMKKSTKTVANKYSTGEIYEITLQFKSKENRGTMVFKDVLGRERDNKNDSEKRNSNYKNFEITITKNQREERLEDLKIN